MKRLAKIICIFLVTFSVFANSTSGKSVQWQRIDLENKLREKLIDFLALVVEKDKYFVEVQISASSPNLTLPKFEMPKSEKKKVVQGIKFTDEKNEKSKENAEYILFDKLGILSPLFEQESEGKTSNNELQLKFYQYQEKIQRDLISKTDLFGLITDVDITIAFDQKMEQQKVEEIKKIIQKIIPSFGGVKAKVETFKMNFYEKKKVVEKKEEKKEQPFNLVEFTKENVSNLSGPVGTILATVLVCLTAFIMLAGYKKHQRTLAEVTSSTSSSVDESSDEPSTISKSDQVDPDFRPGSPQLIEAISTEKEGVKKLFLYLEKSNDQACNLIKKWINLDSSLSNATLLILSERMSIDELYQVFEKLSSYEREAWIRVSGNNDITPDLKQQADAFIAQQVMEDIMTVSATDDADLQKLLVELTPSKAATMAKKNTDHGALLINLMSSNFLTQMYLQLTSDEISEISTKGLKMTTEEIGQKTSDLKDTLKDMVVQKYQNPFSRRVVEVISEIDPIRQENLIDALIEGGQTFILTDVVKKVIPVRVFEMLPPEVNKEIFKGINKDLRLNYIISLDEDKRGDFVNSVSQEGTKGREVLDFEINKILEDEVAVKRIQNIAEEIKRNYIVEARKIIKGNEEILLRVQEQTNNWLSELTGEGDQIEEKAA